MSAVLDRSVKPGTRPYLEAFGRGARAEPEWLNRLRWAGMARFAETGFPDRRSESWRYIDLRALEEKPLLPNSASDEPSGPVQLDAAALSLPSHRLAFADACFLPAESGGTGPGDLPAGVWLGPMADALRDRPELLRTSLAEPEGGEQPLAALNTALFADGFVLDIAPGVILDRPIEILHLASRGEATSLHTRNVISLGAGSRATIVETHTGTGRYWRNAVTTVTLGDGAELTRIVLLEEAEAAVHTGLVTARLDAGAHFDEFALLLSGGTVRHEAQLALAGEGAQCRLDGAFIVAGRDQANIVTVVDHQAPGGQTRELIKGVGAGRGQGAFQGRIIVRPGAQKTDAQQTSRNLIIGDRAVIDTKPELEIYADDVKCAHGATVGDLDRNALFYLRARGIPEEEARRILIEGFAREAVEQVQHPELREHLLRRLGRRLASLEA